MPLALSMTCLLLGVLAQGTEPSPEDLTTAWYDLRPLLSAVPDDFWEGVDLRVHADCIALDNLDPEHYGVDVGADATISMGALRGSILRILHPQSKEEVERLVHHRGRLRVLGDRAQHAVVADTVAALSAVALDSAWIEVYAVDGPRELPARISGARLGELAGSGDAVLLHAATIPFGRTTTFGGELHAAHVSDMWVDMAGHWMLLLQDAIGIRTGGTRIGVRIDRSAGGAGTVLRAWGRSGEDMEADRKVPLQPYGGRPLTLPSVQTALFAGSAKLGPGEVLVLASAAPSARAYAIRVTPGTAPAATAKGSRASILHLGEHAVAPMGLAGSIALGAAPLHEHKDEDVIFEDLQAHFWDRPAAESIADAALAPADRKRAKITYGSTFIVPGAAMDALGELDPSARVPTVSVELAYAAISRDEAKRLNADALREDGSLAMWTAMRGWRRVWASALAGDTLMAVSGTGHRYLADYEVLEGKFISGPFPLTKSIFEGFGG